MYKDKLVEKLIEKKERAEKIREQQQRISDVMNTTVRTHADHTGLLSATHKRA